MAAPKITAFIVMMIVFMMILAGGFGGLMAELNANYDDNVGYNESELDAYNKLTDITEDTQKLKESSLNLTSESGTTDVLGGFFESGYNALKIAFGSFGVFNDVFNQAFDNVPIDRADVYKAGLGAIVIVMIVVGIIVAAAIKRDT